MKVKVLIVQLEAIAGDIKGNISKAKNMLANCGCSNCDLIILPELWTIGWNCEKFNENSETINSSVLIPFFKELALKYNSNIIGGTSIIRKENEKDRNTSFVFNRKGEMTASYDKYHLFSHRGESEGTYLESGTTEKKVLPELMNASTMGGMAIAQDGTGIPHGLSYSLTYKLQIPHGKAVGYFTAGYLAAADESDRRTVLDILGFSSVEQFQEYYLRMYGKTDVPHEILEQAVDELWKNKKKLSTAPFDVDKEKLEEIAFYTIMHS